MSAPKPGEYWATEKGGYHRIKVSAISGWVAAEAHPQGDWLVDGTPLCDFDRDHYGRLTHRVNPDGTPYNAKPAPDYKAEAAKLRRLIRKITKATTIHQVRTILEGKKK